jgi:hypothetical protein
MKRALPILFTSLWIVSCEDGPDQIFSPFEGDPKDQNGFQKDPDVFVQPGEKGFDDIAGGDSVGSAQFCDETQRDELIQQMVVAPIIPDVSCGLIPLWGADGKPLLADDLVGLPANGKFCDPTGLYLDAFTWGPTDEVIVFFDPETRLVDGVIAYQQYLGTMEGDYTDANGAQVHVVVQPRERLEIGGVELDRYASRADAATLPTSWLNPVNVTNLYRMVRETFFGAQPFPADFDCVAEQLCDLIYTGINESIPQDTFIIIQDSGIQIRFTPEGHAIFVYLQPVRSAPFENGADLAFGPPNGTEMRFDWQSRLRQSCSLNLDGLTWADFMSRCIASGDERALDRVNYNVDTSRDAVAVEFNGVDLYFLRNTRVRPVLKDGERPEPSDTLFSMGFSRSLAADVDEFRPMSIGTLYKERLEARLQASVAGDCAANPAIHPFCTYAVTVPFTTNDPQRIGELLTDAGDSWVPMVLAEVEALYASLNPLERDMVPEDVIDSVFLIEPFVDAVLFAFSHGESDLPATFKAFRTTDDRRWSIGYASFRRNGVAYRLEAQYSLNYGAITYVRVSRGESEIDRLLGVAAAGDYFQIEDTLGDSIASIGAQTIIVSEFDRQLETLTMVIPETVGDDYVLEVSGLPLEDYNGYFRQIRGERYEFIPAHELRLLGKESYVVVWIREDGTVGRAEVRLFKGELELCDGLPIRYGDNVRKKIEAWSAANPPSAYRDCDLAFNYSPNGNVLDEIASISNRRSFVVVDGRAVTARVWE